VAHCYDHCETQAWHFRRDPKETGGLFNEGPESWDGCSRSSRRLLYITDDMYGIADSAFLAVYRLRLRRVLAEAVPGVGAFSEW
jgi:hypothetical protein